MNSDLEAAIKNQYLEEQRKKNEQAQRAVAEARRFLAGNPDGVTPLEFMEEVEARAKVSRTVAQLTLGHLEERGETSYSLGKVIAPVSLQAPNPVYLSDYSENLAPVTSVDLHESDLTPANTRKARMTQRVIQDHLEAGAKVFIKTVDGEFEEIVFA